MGSNGRPGFDADARASARESAPVVIGGCTYYPSRLTNRRLREIRASSRKLRADARQAAKDADEYREALEEALNEGKDRKEAEDIALMAGMATDAVSELNTRAMCEQFPILLHDGEGNAPPPEQIIHHVNEDLDSRDVEALMEYLMGPDPTTSPETTTTGS